jgi:hypothetical protein
VIDSLAVAREKMSTLAATRSPEGDILSIAVSTSRLDDWAHSVPVYLHSEFSRVVKERGLAGDRKRRLQSGLDYALDLLKYDLTPRTQGVAVFSDGGPGVTERIELPLRLTNCLTVEPWPYVRPLAHALSLLEPFVLAEVSRDESSLYVVDEWGVVSEDDLAGPWLRTSDRETGEVSIKKYYAAARRDSLVEQHYKEVGVSLAKLLELSGARRVALCAQHDIAAAFRRSLQNSTAGAVVVEMALDAASTVGQRVASARKAVGQSREQQMGDLAARITEGMGPGGHGVAGFEGILEALGSGRLHTLLVDRGYRVPGWYCAASSWVTLSKVDRCPLCGAEVTPLMDAVGELVRLTILENGQVEVGENVKGLERLGGVAGLLRYA